MISTEFAVDEKKSYIKSFGYPALKPNVPSPLIVPLTAGGKIALKINERKSIAHAEDSGLYFITDKLEKSSKQNITGNLQKMLVMLSNLDLKFDPKSGNILDSGASASTYVMGEPQVGGAGALALMYLGQSSLFDGYKKGFNISDGFGCGGGLVLEFGCGNPTNFIIHIEATVAKEDADGDGTFELICPSSTWRRKLNLEYDPPKIRIIVPTHDLVNHWLYAIDVIHAIRFLDFLKIVKNWPGNVMETPRIESIELVGAPDLWFMLFDSKGMVYGGNLSDDGTKVIRMPPVDFENLRIGIMPNLGMSMDRT
jgi:hypothetical protein